MNSSRKFNITINGNEYSIELQKAEDGVASVEVNGTHYDVAYEAVKKESKTPTLVRKPVYGSSEERPKSFAKPEESKVRGVQSPLPGVILELKIKNGDTVKAGQVMLIMEAMKMENNIVAPADGTIKDIKVSKGDNVMEGDLLIEIGA
jgi:glutaconyl-CoA/methylmalonyl-CoA decarboxylase subunit gamma